MEITFKTGDHFYPPLSKEESDRSFIELCRKLIKVNSRISFEDRCDEDGYTVLHIPRYYGESDEEKPTQKQIEILRRFYYLSYAESEIAFVRRNSLRSLIGLLMQYSHTKFKVIVDERRKSGRPSLVKQ